MKPITTLVQLALSLSVVGAVSCGAPEDDCALHPDWARCAGSTDADDGDVSNTAPVAEDDDATTMAGVTVEIKVVRNDDDAEGDDLVIVDNTEPSNGTVEVTGDETLSYTPDDGFEGSDSFEYTIEDEGGLTASATVTVVVREPATLAITSPSEDDWFDTEVIGVDFRVDGCEVSSPSTNKDGCHLHKWIDGVPYTNVGGDGHEHFSTNGFLISPIANGVHDFQLQLVSNDGSDQPFVPLIEDTVSFEVAFVTLETFDLTVQGAGYDLFDGVSLHLTVQDPAGTAVSGATLTLFAGAFLFIDDDALTEGLDYTIAGFIDSDGDGQCDPAEDGFTATLTDVDADETVTLDWAGTLATDACTHF